jgi:hypothetical protein
MGFFYAYKNTIAINLYSLVIISDALFIKTRRKSGTLIAP